MYSKYITSSFVVFIYCISVIELTAIIKAVMSKFLNMNYFHASRITSSKDILVYHKIFELIKFFLCISLLKRCLVLKHLKKQDHRIA